MTEENKNLAPEGTFPAQLADWGMKEASTGNLMAVAQFDFRDDNGKTHSSYWSGTILEGESSRITFEVLEACGFDFSKLSNIAKGIDGKALELGSKVKIRVEHEASQTDGKIYARVKSVYGTGIRNALSEKEVVQKFAGPEALLAKYKFENSRVVKKKAPQGQQQQDQQQTPPADPNDIPF